MAYAPGLKLADTIGSLFQPDTLAEVEYSKTLQRVQHFKPEEQLMLAVLEDAIFCFQKYLFAHDRKGRALFQDAEEWILETDGEWFFSFNNICEALGISPSYLRQGLLRWKIGELESSQRQLESRRRGQKKKPALRNHMVPYR